MTHDTGPVISNACSPVVRWGVTYLNNWISEYTAIQAYSVIWPIFRQELRRSVINKKAKSNWREFYRPYTSASRQRSESFLRCWRDSKNFKLIQIYCWRARRKWYTSRTRPSRNMFFCAALQTSVMTGVVWRSALLQLNLVTYMGTCVEIGCYCNNRSKRSIRSLELIQSFRFFSFQNVLAS